MLAVFEIEAVNMTQLLVRNLDPSLVDQLKHMAKLHHRSLQGEIKFILEKIAAIPADKVSTLLGEPADKGWPADFFEKVVGHWQGEKLVRLTQGKYEKRDDFE